jgi:hypothetical protein
MTKAVDIYEREEPMMKGATVLINDESREHLQKEKTAQVVRDQRD